MIKLLAAAAMLSGQAAVPPAVQCVAREQVADLVVTIAPYFIDGARTRCAAHLPPSTYLLQPAAAQLAERMRAEATRRRASAVATIRTISRNPMPGVSDQTLINVMGEGIAGIAMTTPNPGVCRDVNAIIESMSVMSPDQIGRFFVGIAGIGGRARRGTINPPICDEDG
jgi:hypothetical protein